MIATLIVLLICLVGMVLAYLFNQDIREIIDELLTGKPPKE